MTPEVDGDVRRASTRIPLPRMLILLSLVPLLWSCGPGDSASVEGDVPGEAGEAAEGLEDATLGEEEAEEALPGADLAGLPVTFRQAQAGFPHDPHQQIACTRCHQAIEGHATHRAVSCSSCHNVPDASEGTAVPSRTQCMSCHHEPRPTFTCSRCHDTGDIGWVQVSQRLEVAGTAATRRLPFLHERHGEVECRSCHTGGPTLEVERACGSCHQEHHRQESECLTCHAGLPLETHELRSHEGCSGAGCHTDPVIPSLTLTRNVCLVCHQDQVDHERGRECGTCHLVGEESPEERP